MHIHMYMYICINVYMCGSKPCTYTAHVCIEIAPLMHCPIVAGWLRRYGIRAIPSELQQRS